MRQVRAKRGLFHSVIDRAVHMQSGRDDPGQHLECSVLEGVVGATAKAEICFKNERSDLVRTRSITGWLSSKAVSLRPKRMGSQENED